MDQHVLLRSHRITHGQYVIQANSVLLRACKLGFHHSPPYLVHQPRRKPHMQRAPRVPTDQLGVRQIRLKHHDVAAQIEFESKVWAQLVVFKAIKPDALSRVARYTILA